MKNFKKLILAVLFLPILLSIDIFKSERSILKKIGLLLVVWLILGSTWSIGYYRNIFSATEVILYETGISDKLTDIKVSGTSMTPTILDNSTVTLHSPKKYGVERGDIVSFKNIETGNSYYIKRVIGLENEQISIINGKVIINGKTLKEDYVNHGDPTYGNTYLTDCENYIIPKGKVAVLGDNRIVSMDSRVLGFIDVKDIDGVIKTNISPEFLNEETTNNLQEKNIDSSIFLEKLNEIRKENDSQILRVAPTLDNIASQRSQQISGDFENWKQDSIPLTQILDKSGYQYLLVQEYTTFGYLNEEQLVKQIMESPLYRNEFLSDRYYEIGVGLNTVNKGSCKIPVIDVILSWPTNPSYSQKIVDSWQTDIDYLERVILTLKQLKSNPKINQEQTQKLIDELTNLLSTANSISSQINQNQWLTEGESNNVEDYIKKSESSIEKLKAYYELNSKTITDQNAQTLLTELLPGNTEFNKKTQDIKLLFGQGKYSEQLQSSQELLNIAETYQEKAIAYYWMGLAQYELYQNQEAEKNLLLATTLDLEYAAPYVTLSAINMDKKDYQQALKYAQKCVELDPEYGWCHNNLGLTYLYLGDKEKAIPELEKAVFLDPTSYVFNDNLKRAKAN